MTESNFDLLGQADWRKRVHQLKQELRSTESDPQLVVPEQVKGYGTELKPKRAAGSAPLPRVKS